MLPHTASPPPMAPYTLPPSLPHSPKRRELIKDARRQHADPLAVQPEVPGHETIRQSALTLSTSTCPLCPSACTCMFPMHMRHARVQRATLSLALHMRAPCTRVCICRCICICMCMCECVCVCACVCVCVCVGVHGLGFSV
jgi:hypothetical protein